MKRLIVLMGLLALVGCGQETVDTAGALVAATVEDLPNCAVGKYSAVYYVVDEEAFYYCDGADWVLIPSDTPVTTAYTVEHYDSVHSQLDICINNVVQYSWLVPSPLIDDRDSYGGFYVSADVNPISALEQKQEILGEVVSVSFCEDVNYHGPVVATDCLVSDFGDFDLCENLIPANNTNCVEIPFSLVPGEPLFSGLCVAQGFNQFYVPEGDPLCDTPGACTGPIIPGVVSYSESFVRLRTFRIVYGLPLD